MNNPIIKKRVMDFLNLSESTAQSMQGWANAAIIFGSILALTGTICAIWSQVVVNRYTDIRISTNERATNEAIRDANVAKDSATKANLEIARANERASEMEKQAALAQLETEKVKAALAKTTEMATPPMLVHETTFRTNGPDDATWTVVFKSTKNIPLGVVQFRITVIGESSATIESVEPAPLGSFSGWSDGISKDKTSATVEYFASSGFSAGFNFRLSKPGRVYIESNRLVSPIALDVE